MVCEHETQAMEKARIVDESYEEYAVIEYTPRCERCNKILPKEKIRYGRC